MMRRLICACALSASVALGGSLSARVDGTKYLFIFGDSYTSTGFNIAGAKPSAAAPLGNPPIPGTTLAGGMTWAGHLTTELNSSLTLTYNFAVSGATVDNSIVAAFDRSIPDIITQVKTWTTNLQPKPSYAPWSPANSLFIVWIGVNDVGNSYANSGEDARINKDLDQLFSQLTILYKGGARSFAVMNIPPSNKTPYMRAQSNVASLVSAIDNWNGQLPSRVMKFAAANPEANVTIIDTQIPFNEAINNPAKYGAQDATCLNCDGNPIATCQSVKACLWYNSYHPAQPIQKLVAQAVANALKGTWF